MIAAAFHHIFFLPLYNALVWLSAIMPGADVGLAIILLTLIVRALLFPLQHQMVRTQKKLKELEPQLQSLKVKHAADKNEQAKQLMALYREHGINPFAGFLVLIIQLPILLALFWVFKDSFHLNPLSLYSFVTPPAALNTNFLSILDISQRSYVLGLLAGLSQFFQMKLALPPTPAQSATTSSLKDELGRSLSLQMRYLMPAMLVFISFGLPAALPLYWLTSNLFSLGHELFVRRQARKI